MSAARTRATAASIPPPTAKPRLRLAATLWSFVGHPSPGREWSLDRKVAAIAAAGFEGVQSVHRPEIGALARRHQLALIGAFDAEDPANFRQQIADLVADGAAIANIQVAEHDTPPAQALKWTLAVRRECRRQGLRWQIETHRGTATETPEKFAAIAAGYRRATGELLPVTWDHSHFAVTKHLRPEHFSARLLTAPALVQRSRLIHCRPFNGHHCQIAVTDARGRRTPEYHAWLVFARDLFAQWLAGAAGGAELWVVVEQGSAAGGYNLSVFNPPWHDALVCARDLRALWRSLLLENANRRGS
jgi:hypothetical protein